MKALGSLNDDFGEVIASTKETASMKPCKLSDSYVAESAKQLQELHDSNDALLKKILKGHQDVYDRADQAIASWNTKGGLSDANLKFLKVLICFKS